MVDKELYDFALLVKKMRGAQKAYFATRTRSALAEAKRLEREVDEAVKRILSGQS